MVSWAMVFTLLEIQAYYQASAASIDFDSLVDVVVIFVKLVFCFLLQVLLVTSRYLTYHSLSLYNSKEVLTFNQLNQQVVVEMGLDQSCFEKSYVTVQATNS